MTVFWDIANNACILFVLVAFDFERKVVEYKEPFYTSDKEEDIEKMKAYFRTIKGKYPEMGVK